MRLRGVDLDLEGWAAISHVLGLSRHQGRHRALREVDPLPVVYLLGRTCASTPALVAWKAREERRLEEARDAAVVRRVPLEEQRRRKSAYERERVRAKRAAAAAR